VEDANGYRDEVVSRAKGEADRFTKLVAEYRKAPEVTRERLYLDTMQEVFSNTSKVLVTGDKGQNNLLYLPLDKMIDSSRNGSTSSGGSAAAPVVDPGSRAADMQQQRDTRTRETR
jgi:membrane protease subunit HflK